ncbi:amidohydrolase family protein [Phaeobacter marinintestinus]|uniref:amidohydrolase family protein n=1 Tax=Falsiphaeobacter marinintestinus TaxID=1492905 RepID=UPI0011B567F5|nr:amidohydrolase family protein [Phaeobacter marinintestinus]
MTDQYIVSNIRVPAAFTDSGQEFHGDLVIGGGHVVSLRSAPTSDPRLVIPALVDAHCHLDKCHTIDRLPDVGGDLAHAITAQARDKANWTVTDLRARASRGVNELVTSGCRIARSHLDWGDTAAPPLAWSVLSELAQDTAPDIDLTLCPLVDCDLWQDPVAGSSIARTAASRNSALGCFLFNQPNRRIAVKAMFALAEQFGTPLDFHVDEGLSDGLDGLKIIADAAIETGFQGPVLCGHACSLMNLHGNDLGRLLDKLLAANITVAALPTTNLYLQGRTNGTPDRRGLTRLRELRDAGVPIVLASDNVADAFCPVGQHDPMAALHLAILAGHLDPPLDRWLSTITTDAARALGRDPITVLGADIRDLRVSDARSLPSLVSGSMPLTAFPKGDTA